MLNIRAVLVAQARPPKSAFISHSYGCTKGYKQNNLGYEINEKS
jgi:hypothetical protein